jgi:hypothetical protein
MEIHAKQLLICNSAHIVTICQAIYHSPPEDLYLPTRGRMALWQAACDTLSIPQGQRKSTPVEQ